VSSKPTRRDALKAAGGATLAAGLLGAAEPEKPMRPPNFIVILCDNLGYGDVGPFGSTKHRTPHLDRMAAEGIKLTSFYATSGVCTPSRASLLTGCYPRRVSLHVNERGGAVLFPVSPKGLHPDEATIASVLKARGYATVCIGKWHLGDQTPFLPTRHGFDSYLGIPYSDDMVERKAPGWPPLPLMRGERVIEAPVDRNTLTRRYTEEAQRFIEASRDKPFFLYLPHAMPGSTAAPFASERFRGKSANGPYGDSVEELDWSTGEILATLKRLGLDEQTLIVWTSDNGAVRHTPPQGSNAPLRGWGYTTDEGGMRVPCIVRWPSRVRAGATCDELCTTMDLLPTFARLGGTGILPVPRDGKDIWPLLSGEDGAKSPYDAFFYYYLGQLQAVRSGHWKLYLPLDKKWVSFGGQTRPAPAELYDLKADIGEKSHLAAQQPDVVARLLAFAGQARDDLGDIGRDGRGQRPAGHVERPVPQLLSQ